MGISVGKEKEKRTKQSRQGDHRPVDETVGEARAEAGATEAETSVSKF